MANGKLDIFIKSALNSLLDFFGIEKELSEEAGNKYKKLFRNYPKEVIGEAITHWMDTHRPTPYSFPTVAEMESELIEAKHGLRIQQEEREKTKQVIPPITPISSNFVQLLQQLINKKLRKRKEYPVCEHLADLGRLANLFPAFKGEFESALSQAVISERITREEAECFRTGRLKPEEEIPP